MEFLADTLATLQDLVAANAPRVLLATSATAGLALLLSLWSLGRRRGVRRLSKLAAQLEYRVHMLEVAEHDRTLRRITARERSTDFDPVTKVAEAP